MKPSSELIDPCPRCGSAEYVEVKLVLVDRLDPSRAADETRTWESMSAGRVSVTDLKPELMQSGPAGQFIEGLHCKRCDVGYLAESILKPSRPRRPPIAPSACSARDRPPGTAGSKDIASADSDEVDVSRTSYELGLRRGRGAYVVATGYSDAASAAGEVNAAQFWSRVASGIKPR